ncbi:MAG: carboxylating nicotinate-nucleotide diphosphorylase [Chitinophagales bacterium]|jgi:nicotinate-nucleotide pyrophosphorylase (carboxylating)|nr:carboxylating nicotinate-nucleotide diphosphorylase [Chitinophagales bacterium]
MSLSVAERLLVDKYILLALEEDACDPTGKILVGDHSTLASIPAEKAGSAKLFVKADGVLAGVELAEIICGLVDKDIRFEQKMNDGDSMKKGDIAFFLHGRDRSILTAERIILNCMQRMSGIATTTKQYVDLIAGTKAKVLDTRKTTPNFRVFEKMAVRIGGGHNHRFGLYDMIMLKDNHIDFCGGIKKAILAVKNYQEENGLHLPVEVETRSLQDIQEVLETGFATRIMFDNFSVDNTYKAVELVNGKFETESSGGINLNTIKGYAETGVDFISVGALTHSSISLDLSLKAI